MEIVSTAFENGNPLHVKYTKKGDNIPPPLKFKKVPENTKSLALIVDDPGGPLITFVHWIVWNIPPNITEISKGAKLPILKVKTVLKNRGI
jgi:Raf kinase inhibitor-like YbhB/YbcL family protein